MTTRTETETIRVYYNENKGELELNFINEDGSGRRVGFKKSFSRHMKQAAEHAEWMKRWKFLFIADGSRMVQYRIVEKKVRV